MSYLALYRAWRPETFSQIVGQDAVVTTLRRQVQTGRVAHAYLFCGTRGTGKTTAAKVLSRAINCLEPEQGDPCGRCEICRQLLAETCMDVVEIDAASNNGVDEIRDLREKVKFPPAVTRYRVYIIDEVHMLSTGAFNALLKTLEEPPAHAVFILATTEPQRLPATILSRCQRFDFRRLEAETIVGRMRVVLQGVGREAADEALAEIARAAEGSMRDALSLLDVCLSYTDGRVEAQLVRDALGTAGTGFVFDFVDALTRFDAHGALLAIDEMTRRGLDAQVFARDVAAHLRALMLARCAPEQLARILECTPEDAQRYCRQAQQAQPEQVMRALELFMRLEPDMKWASNPRAMLELTAVRACCADREEDASLPERVARLEKLAASGAPLAAQGRKEPAQTPPAREKSRPSGEAARPQSRGGAEKPGAIEVAPAFLQAVEALKRDNPSMRAALGGMRFVSADEETLVCEFARKEMMFLKMLERKQAAMEAAFSEAFGRPMRLKMRLEGEGAPAAPAGASTQARRVIEQSYDVFGRENIDLTD